MHELGIIPALPIAIAVPNPNCQFPARLSHWPQKQAQERIDSHGDTARWSKALNSLPDIDELRLNLESGVCIEGRTDSAVLEQALQELHPWRKGPWKIGGVEIDTEWRSDWKWDRLSAHVAFDGAEVLDVGCGNGYFGWRMLGAGAEEVVGVDPTVLFCMQHQVFQHYLKAPNWVLPLGIDELPRDPAFDIVLSMGVIYHRRDPQAHVDHLAALARPGGQIVIESLVAQAQGFTPEDRYARMRNVWRIPSVREMVVWCEAAGLEHIRCVDRTPTTTAEQRSTNWMTFDSLKDTLDPADPRFTIEGYNAPVRAIVIASKPGG